MRREDTDRRGPSDHGALGVLVARTRGPRPWRRLMHAANGLGIVACLVFLPFAPSVVVGTLTVVLAALVLVDVLRLQNSRLNELFFRLFTCLASPREAHGPASSTWYVLGVVLTLALFPVEASIPAVLVLALADPTAGCVGGRWGRKRLGRGTLEGSAAFFAVAAGLLLLATEPLAALVTAGVVTVVELLPWRVDDNLTIPLAAGASLWALGLL